MKKILTSEATGPALDWAVAKCESEVLSQSSLVFQIKEHGCLQRPHMGNWKPSSLWAQGGPIIEREGIDVITEKGTPESWFASVSRYQNGKRLYGWRIHQYGPTPLVAAMRCYVASKLGDIVEVPEVLFE